MAVVRALSRDKKIRVYYADISDAVDEISRIHSFNEYNKRFFSEAAVGTVLLSFDIKDENTVFSSVLKCSEPFNNTVVVKDSLDSIKGYSSALIESDYDFKKDIKNNAVFSAIIDTGTKYPYVTEVPVCEDSMEACIADYFEQSQQQKSIVRMDSMAARGIVLCPVLNSEFKYIEAQKETLSTMLDGIMNAASIYDVKSILSNTDFDITEEYEIKAQCTCTSEKMESVIVSLGKKEATEIVAEMGALEIVCPYCLKKYKFDAAAIEALF